MPSIQPEKFLEHFSIHLKNSIARSISITDKLGHKAVTPAHLLLALSEEQGAVAAEILSHFTCGTDTILAYLNQAPPRPAEASHLPELDTASKQVLEKAMLHAYEREQNHVGTEHLLYGLLEINDKDVDAIMSASKTDKIKMKKEIETIMQRAAKFPDMDEMHDVIEQFQDMMEHDHESVFPQPKHGARPGKKSEKQLSALDVFTTELTAKRIQERLDPVVGRDKEIDRVIRTLSRRTKNNPILIGEPGVGKTAIVEGLAKKIATGDIPDILKRKKILSLDLTLLVAGTMYRGEFEARLKQLVDELSRRSDTILFIDEIHNIIGAGSNQGTMDAANILKPALARGALRCIGATTIDEYQKHIAGDPALERRFHSIHIEEPSRDDTIAILLGLKKYYENFHGTLIAPDAIEAAVDLSMRYVHDNYLPDKAIDLIDEAGASVRVSAPSSSGEKERQAMLRKISEYEMKKEGAIESEALKDAVRWKEKETALRKKLARLDKKKGSAGRILKDVTKEDIAHVLGSKINMAPEQLLRDEWTQLAAVEESLKHHIIGQDHVIEELIAGLRHAHLRINEQKKPFASFLFVGPSGVGKTALSKALARELYHDEKALVKLDMSEFAEAHSVSKLLGSPAGYIGYKERNRFTDELRKRPYAVLVFDEYDKAHPDVQKLLFQILDEGELTDSHGKKIYFHHTVVILTTNVGSELYASGRMGFDARQERGAGQLGLARSTEQLILERLKDHFGASLLGRLGRTLLFRELTRDDMLRITERVFSTFNAHLEKSKQVSIIPHEDVVQALATEAAAPDTGVRHIERTVERMLHEKLMQIMAMNRKKKQYTLTRTAGTYTLV